tara:strand:+ start:1255 stop:1455 length:201 start_codon:yes stop_codon:yes gene_type:complete
MENRETGRYAPELRTRAVAQLRGGRVRRAGMDGFNNRRLVEPVGNIPTAEAEVRDHARSREFVMAA